MNLHGSGKDMRMFNTLYMGEIKDKIIPEVFWENQVSIDREYPSVRSHGQLSLEKTKEKDTSECSTATRQTRSQLAQLRVLSDFDTGKSGRKIKINEIFLKQCKQQGMSKEANQRATYR